MEQRVCKYFNLVYLQRQQATNKLLIYIFNNLN